MKNEVKMNKELNEQYMQYLSFIQRIIERHNSNSFQIKTFAITIFSAITALYISSQIEYLYLISLATTFMFWLLDAIYLLQERKFRKLYDDAVKCKVNIYSMNINKYENNICDYIKTMFSKTLVSLYIVLIVIQIIIVIIRYKSLM